MPPKREEGWREDELLTCLPFHFLCPDSSEETPPATQNFIIPKKEIHTVPDMGKWKRSQVRVTPALEVGAGGESEAL